MRILWPLKNRKQFNFMDRKLSPTISVCVLINNEVDKVEDFILSVINFADEIIFADRGSTDGTLDVINRFIAQGDGKIKLYNYSFNLKEGMHFGKAKNFVMGKATKDFILCLDADERLSDEFKANIRQFLKAEDPEVVSVVRIDELLVHLIERVDRIAKNRIGIFYGTTDRDKVHEEFSHNYQTKKFDSPIWHCQRETHWLQKPQQRLFLIALEVDRTPKTKSFLGHLLRGCWLFQFKFKKVYFKQSIYKDGWPGLKFAFMRGLHAFLVELFVGLKPAEGYKYWEDKKSAPKT